jgi:uncharacterized protein
LSTEVIYTASLYLLSLSAPLWTGMAGASLWWLATRRGKIAVATLASMLLFSGFDLIMFKSLPYLGLSFGPARVPYAFMALVRAVVTLGAATLLIAYLVARWLWNRSSVPQRSSPLYFVAPLLVNLAISGCLVDGLFMEPREVKAESIAVQPRMWAASAAPLRIVQLSDIHMEQLTGREQDATRMVNDLHPDLILMTGDYLSIDDSENPRSLADLRWMISRLRARYGIYAVWGNTDPHRERTHWFDGLGVTLLQDEMTTLHVSGQTIHLLGLDKRDPRYFDGDRAAFGRLIAQMPEAGVNILLYHTPDLMPEAAASGKIDLYLAGHTHGGQIRLPFYGAIVTSSIYHKAYEAGLYHEGRTALYVNRGLGLEGGPAPRVRFLCPPEITTITLGPSSQREHGAGG